MAEDLQNPAWKYCVMHLIETGNLRFGNKDSIKKITSVSSAIVMKQHQPGVEDNAHACMLQGKKKRQIAGVEFLKRLWQSFHYFFK